MKLVALAIALLWLNLVGCAHRQQPTPTVPSLDEREAVLLVGSKAKDPEGWANDIVAAIRATKKEPTAERVCAVVAVIEQESGYQADPPVANLPKIVNDALAEKLSRLGPLAKPTLHAVLDDDMKARIAKLKTERDLDRLFREAISRRLPSVVSSLSGIDELNPVTTAGSMQVQVSFAKELSGLNDAETRELLYTRAGGVRFGTARLIGYQAAYDDIVFRFADYNAGQYSSRNAAFQSMLNDLVGTKLALDGDLLNYDDDVDSDSLRAMLAFGARHGLSERAIRRDAKKEKEQDFEDTRTWRGVRAAWQAKTGRLPPYARVPDVALSSPKLSRARTTAWFADNVKRHYLACRKRQNSLASRLDPSAAVLGNL